MLHTSQIEISESAFQNNVDFIRNLIGPNVRFSSVVKGNAYGHGIHLFVPLAERCGTDHFSVFSANEAESVKKACVKNPTILILGMLDNPQIEWAIANDIEFYVFDLDRLENTIAIAKKLNKKAHVHIEVETGMNRTGFDYKSLTAVSKLILNAQDYIDFVGFCTHFAGAESVNNYYRVKKQQANYLKSLRKIQLLGLTPKTRHTACSAATLNLPKMHFDMVRIGILQYGYFPGQEVLVHYLTKNKSAHDPLRRIISWKSKIMDIKHIKTGDYVGYGTSYLANQPTKVATIPVGYSHGFSRILSNRGRILINERRVQVIGMVNMNMMAVDVTNVPSVKKGDEIVLIGKQGDLEISVASFGEASSQVNYELLTRLPQDIPRKIIEG